MVKLAVVGVGNCACAFLQAIGGLRSGAITHAPIANVDGLVPAEKLEVVAAFDIDARKVDQPLQDAIFAPPNCTSQYLALEPLDVVVSPGVIADGVNGPLGDLIPIAPQCNAIKIGHIAEKLRVTGAELMVIYLPVGAQEAAESYAEAALQAGCGVVNNTPALLACSPVWQARFTAAGLPLVGDDMKSHIGSTTLHQAILRLLAERGLIVENTYQLNIGGNTDFLNMRDIARSAAKRRTKAQALTTLLPSPAAVGIGPSDYIPHLRDNKVGYIHIEGTGYLGMPFSIELRLTVEDSPNSAAVSIEACRVAATIARDGTIDVARVAAELFKSPWAAFRST